jgi:hypothetical protein
MPLLEPEVTSTPRVLFLAGIPSLLAAVLLSMLVHHYAHDIVRRHWCPSAEAPKVEFTLLQEGTEGAPDCPVASLYAIGATLALALGAFGLLLHSPRNVFFACLAFVNVTMRIPGGLASFVQALMHRTSHISADEASALSLLHLGDPVGYIFILALYDIALVFFALIIVNDTRTVGRKWIIAAAVFVLLPPFEAWVWPMLRRLL